ncbi:MAG: CPBP family intramembrane metalloprotease [Clostridia bacterium]|nr:CPBP family intramembrane metalloprotease [Clostridia bacterium]
MKRLINRYPILSSAVIIFLFWEATKLISYLWPQTDKISAYFIYEGVMILLPFLLTVIFGDARVYTQGGMLRTFWAGGYMAISQLLLFCMMLAIALLTPETQWVGPVGALYGIVSLFGIGFREESLFRGIVVNNIAKKYITDRRGIFFTASASGLLFGLIHMTNVFAGVDLFSATIQSVVAIGAGFYFAAVYLRGGSLWALIIMHTVADAASLFNATFTVNNGSMIDSINEIGIRNLMPFFILTGIGLFLLRKEKCEEIIACIQKEEAH